ncbi:Trifunctional purine biosynthetic protein adenosine-3 [Orchesella cincta]|uniref:Trifunctional purine biosynthetic protein adenosine-3 n=1 Tax=Orchesella cincta TaxID=48709 RepID=A0A1D2MVX7_ORCCI|nr:Trifunctional purine biosynthetic protein adenosine-3 [Orchesella cincta]
MGVAEIDTTGGPTKVLLIGSGGREHAIAWKLAQSPKVAHIYVAPGNAGITLEKKTTCVNVDIEDHQEVANWCKQNGIGMVVVGPEDPLSLGIVDVLNNNKIPVFGPRRAAAQIEASKHFAKSFMERHHIPTARWKSFTKPKEAKYYIEHANFPALVVKASGLAAGKGVIVAANAKEASQAVDEIASTFGKASETIIVEELLEGEEVSVLGFSDGNTVSVMMPSQDHKRLKDGDEGPNTGGMGAYCPCPLLTERDMEIVNEQIMKKTIQGLKSEGVRYIGILYAGLMMTKDGPKVLEFNCRFGDPETQVLLPLLESDLFDAFSACINGNLGNLELKWVPNTYTVGVVMASAGYPGTYAKGKEITKLQEVNSLPGHVVFHAGTKLSDTGKVVTSGGRVLIAVALGQELALASAKALHAVNMIHFEGAQFRNDIAKKGISRSLLLKGRMTYKGSGVDIVAGDNLVRNITALTNTTKRTGSMGSLGGFGGLFDIKAAGYKDPILVSGTDGVGTKLKIAEASAIHDTIGIDLVAMCVNDILAHAAEPLFFLDYFATGKLDVEVATKVIIGVAEGCRQAGCALVGGETAEMPSVYEPGVYDVAGFAVGAVEKGRALPYTDKIEDGDIVIGLSSTGLHSNGFSLVRKIVEKHDLKYTDPCPFSNDPNETLGRALLAPTKIYVKSLLPALRSGRVKAFAHITGGGLTENIPRVLPKKLGVEIDAQRWKMPPVFAWVAGAGGISEPEMLKTFNCGLGGILIVSPADQQHVMSMITDDEMYVIGRVRSVFGDDSQVRVKNFADVIAPAMKKYTEYPLGRSTKKRVGVLISGSGTNLQALIDHTLDPLKGSLAEIAIVISNKEGVEGLKRAERAGIPTKVISHKAFPTREEFDTEVMKALDLMNVEIVCLAGFMRILSPSFVTHFRGRLINVHPALLPSFKGADAHKQAIEAGVRYTGCTVHFVEVEVDAGAIITQEAVPVEIGDTIEVLQERVKTYEHQAYPRALELLARDKVRLDTTNGKAVWNL